ncbi:hypothetical protein IE81DRAFT_120787 [Ceraceosorus guamensis]|uniref:Uncharacterized protein n=1 Tax=Ceraceosorus guamensis TaxID=1522189 RepID=A0A316W097_9BASI|nr:hypothetical protein IE81DRAFT_120787 [Ceraceosorus guamensis]PWN42548.1 hypothetical protein IE81DRAFT_120787 [Ceraceosorus guamensis]
MSTNFVLTVLCLLASSAQLTKVESRGCCTQAALPRFKLPFDGSLPVSSFVRQRPSLEAQQWQITEPDTFDTSGGRETLLPPPTSKEQAKASDEKEKKEKVKHLPSFYHEDVDHQGEKLLELQRDPAGTEER